MTVLDDYISSLSEEDRQALKKTDTVREFESSINQEHNAREIFEKILSLQVAHGQISEHDKNIALSEFDT